MTAYHVNSEVQNLKSFFNVLAGVHVKEVKVIVMSKIGIRFAMYLTMIRINAKSAY